MLKEMIIMSPERRVVKEWLRTVDHEELDAMLQAAIFTPDEQRYIHMRLIEGRVWLGLHGESLKRCTNPAENWDIFRAFVTPFIPRKVG